MIEVDQDGVERALLRPLGRGGAGRADRLEVARRDPGEHHDEAEEDQSAVHTMELTPRCEVRIGSASP